MELKREKPSVLQVYALTGLGHLREATSIKNALDEAGIDNDTLDILSWASMHSLYTKLTVIPLKIFKWFFEITTRNTSAFNAFQLPVPALKLFLIVIRTFEVPLGFALRRYLEKSDYDIFIAVHPWGLGALWSFGRGRYFSRRLINVIPDEIDYGSASFYGIPGGKSGPMHLVNSMRVKSLFEEVGVDTDRIKVIGHTLDPNVLKHRDQIFRRVQKKLNSTEPLTLGLYIGGTGTEDETTRIKQIIRDLAPHIKIGGYNIKVIPGPHLEFASELQELRRELKLEHAKNFEIFSSANRDKVIEVGHKWFIEDIDVLFAKTGEIIFYSLGTGIPHIYFPPKGANEVEHVVLMKTLNAIHEFDTIVDLHKFLQDRKYLAELSTYSHKASYKLDGAYEVVRYIQSLLSDIGQFTPKK
ncbi:MAG: hypothetical protein ACE5DX_04650 [Candidatus Dojkabacteria bacterium]